MVAGRYRSLGTTVAHYLLFATVGLLALDVFADVGSRMSFLWLAAAVAATFGALAVGRLVGPRGVVEPAPVASDRPGVEARSVVFVLVVLLAAGGILRWYGLGTQSVWFDEAITINAAVAFLEGGRPTFPSGYTYWRAFPHTLVVAGSMATFGTGEAAARLPSVVFGLASIVATYWLGREVGGRRVGLLAALLVTFATWELAWSRQARMYQLFQLLYVLSLVALLQVERTWFADRRFVVALVVVVALAAFTHPIGYVLLPVCVAYLGAVGAYDGRLTRRTAVWLLVGAATFVVVVESIGAGITGTIESAASTDVDYWDAYVGWLADELHAFFYLGLIGVAVTVYRGWYRTGTLLVLAVAPPVWVLSFHTQLFATRYLYFGLPVLFVWTAVVVEYVGAVAVERAADVRRSLSDDRPSERVLTDPSVVGVPVVAVGLVVLLALGGGFTVTPQAEYDLGTNAPQPDYQGAYEHVTEHRADDDVVVAGWTAPGLYYAGSVEYWLAHDLTGGGGTYTVNDRELYAGAEPVRSGAELEAVIDTHERGWIVVDDVALARQPPEVRSTIEARSVYRSGSMTVAHWNRTESGETVAPPADQSTIVSSK